MLLAVEEHSTLLSKIEKKLGKTEGEKCGKNATSYFAFIPLFSLLMSNRGHDII